MLFASHQAVKAACLVPLTEPRDERDPWTKLNPEPPGKMTALAARSRRFLAKSGRMRYVALANRLRRLAPALPVPLRLPFGAWWLAQHSALDRELIYDGFETAEAAFIARFLRPGMTVLDVGAHHGLYTLL